METTSLRHRLIALVANNRLYSVRTNSRSDGGGPVRPKSATFKTVGPVDGRDKTPIRVFTSVDNPFYFVVPHPEAIDIAGGRGGGGGGRPLLDDVDDDDGDNEDRDRVVPASGGVVHLCHAVITPRFFHAKNLKTALRQYRPGTDVCTLATWNKTVTWFFEVLKQMEDDDIYAADDDEDSTAASATTFLTTLTAKTRKRAKTTRGASTRAALHAWRDIVADAHPHFWSRLARRLAAAVAVTTDDRATLRARRHLTTLLKEVVEDCEDADGGAIRRLHGQNALHATHLVDPSTLRPAFEPVADDERAQHCYRLLCGVGTPVTDVDRATLRLYEMLHVQRVVIATVAATTEEKKTDTAMLVALRALQAARVASSYLDEDDDDEDAGAAAVAVAASGGGTAAAAAGKPALVVVESRPRVMRTYHYSPRHYPRFEALEQLAKTMWRADADTCRDVDELGDVMPLPQESYVVVHDSDVTSPRFLRDAKARGFRAFVDLATERKVLRRSAAMTVDTAAPKSDDACTAGCRSLRDRIRELAVAISADCEARGGERGGRRGRAATKARGVLGAVGQRGDRDQQRAVLLLHFARWDLGRVKALTSALETRALPRGDFVGACIDWSPSSPSTMTRTFAATSSSSSSASSSLAATGTAARSLVSPDHWTTETQATTALAWFARKEAARRRRCHRHPYRCGQKRALADRD